MQFGGRGGSLAGDGRRIPSTFNGKIENTEAQPKSKVQRGGTAGCIRPVPTNQ